MFGPFIKSCIYHKEFPMFKIAWTAKYHYFSVMKKIPETF